METYIGKKPIAGREVSLGDTAVLAILEGTDTAGRNITCGNFFYKTYRLQESCWQKTLRGYNKKK